MSTEMSTFRSQISPENKFSFQTYKNDQNQIFEKIEKENKILLEKIGELEETENRDRILLYQEN